MKTRVQAKVCCTIADLFAIMKRSHDSKVYRAKTWPPGSPDHRPEIIDELGEPPAPCDLWFDAQVEFGVETGVRHFGFGTAASPARFVEFTGTDERQNVWSSVREERHPICSGCLAIAKQRRWLE